MAKQNRLPVFKIRAKVAVWRPADPCPRETMTFNEEVLATTLANWRDLRALVYATIKGKLNHFGVDTEMVDMEIEDYELLAAQTRNYSGSVFEVEPKWVVAYQAHDLPSGPDRDSAIQSLTYLPYDAQEQREVYGI